jgi:hypothetical protein
MRRHQVQLETKNDIFRFEVGTDDYDAVEIAEEFLKKLGYEGPFHVGGYDPIGNVNCHGVIRFNRNFDGMFYKMCGIWSVL